VGAPPPSLPQLEEDINVDASPPLFPPLAQNSKPAAITSESAIFCMHLGTISKANANSLKMKTTLGRPKIHLLFAAQFVAQRAAMMM
jgi:hypothetical protein